MLSLRSSTGSGVRLCDGVSRREWLRVGGLGVAGLTLPALWRRRAAAEEAGAQGAGRRGATGEAGPPGGSAPDGTFGRAKRCIQLFLWGGPGGQETWDLKPDAPSETRGDFRPIATSVPGTQVCEHMPLLAARADRYAIVRSVTHTGVNHGTSAYHMLTGHIHFSPGTLRHPSPRDMPNLGVNAARFLEHPDHLPACVSLPATILDGDGLPVPGQGPGILGDAHAPFYIAGDLTQRDFAVPSLTLADGLSGARMSERRRLQTAIDGRAEHLLRSPSARSVDAYYERALSLLSSAETARAFDLSAEPDAVRERYGRHHFAQALVMARRLIEAGVPLVTVYWDSPSNTDDQSWDTHTDMHRRMREGLLPYFDRSLSALLDELDERGLLAETLVTCWGEFGRTPRINGDGGRDHWGFCQSIVMAGGGIRPGLLFGSSNRDGGYPETGPVSPDDLAATVLHLLGVDHHQLMYDLEGRPIPLSHGRVVRELLV